MKHAEKSPGISEHGLLDLYCATEDGPQMAKTKLGQKVEEWSSSAKEEFKTDLDRVTKLPPDVVRAVVDKIAKTYPACNTTELAALEAEQHDVPD